jgi:putative tryptophan/tyrosine transport system substrate-binding protein
MRRFWIFDFKFWITKFKSGQALFVILCALLIAATVEAQPRNKMFRIGYVSGSGDSTNQGPYVEALRHRLRDLGYIEGKNFVIDFRGAAGKPGLIAKLANELAQSKVDILVIPTGAGVRAAKQATTTTPIVMVTQVDPVAARLVDSMARPGGNITGLATLQRDLSGKRLELLMAVVPKLSRIAVLRNPEDDTGIGFRDYEAAARALSVRLQSLDARGDEPDLEGAFEAARKGRANALITITNAPLFRKAKVIAQLAAKNRLPSIFEGSTWVTAGGLMSYAANDLELFRRAATYVDKILKGSKPADLPIEQPTKFELVINLNTAKQIGLTIPQKVLVGADKVIR